jgi:hypothetical protein
MAKVDRAPKSKPGTDVPGIFFGDPAGFDPAMGME